VAYESGRTGAPFVRPLFYADTADKNLYQAVDQYYFGSSFMVAPVLEKGAKTRRLYLPRGSWYDFWEPKEKVNGGRWIEVTVTPDRIPVYVKAGSVIPMKPAFNNTTLYPKEILEWHYYSGEGSHTFSMYEDDGLSADAEKTKAYEKINMHVNTQNNKSKIRFISVGNRYRGKPEKRDAKWVLHGQQPNRVLIDGKAVEVLPTSGQGWEIMIKDWRDQAVEIRVD
jgi:alpha-glucosidase (family GH31 glycosyl hydrolase)